MPNRIFSMGDQRSFARFTGDYNPLHLDALAARRLSIGGVAVHGVHSVLWGLDQLLCKYGQSVHIEFLRVRFLEPLLVPAEVKCVIHQLNEFEFRIGFFCEGSKAIDLRVRFGAGNSAGARLVDDDIVREKPEVWNSQEISKAKGHIHLQVKASRAVELFPNIRKYLCIGDLASLTSITRLIGMKCPGLHSMLSEIELGKECTSAKREFLDYQVVDYDPRFRLTTLSVHDGQLKGSVKAFLREPPALQPSTAEIRQLVSANEFVDQRALVIGGSRGLGEVTSKILAAGGAEVTLTYNMGSQDAKEVVDNIQENGGVANAFQLDVLDQKGTIKNWYAKRTKPTHLYYFATPHVFVGKKLTFSPSHFDRFSQFYLFGFNQVIESLDPLELRAIFYPSSIAIDEKPVDMAEYIAAKTAGEAYCDYLVKHLGKVQIHVARLPRLATDQTASFFPVFNASPTDTMLAEIRRMSDSVL